jgi:RNA polymerase-binding transcription factor DksA
MKVVRLLIAVVTIVIIVGITQWEAEELTSPGPLHPSHADLPELQENPGCAACHGDGGTSMAQACHACHGVIEDQIAAGQGLHGGLEQTTATACGDCHREHAGEMLALVTGLSFHAADVADPERYDHRHVPEFNLTGRHEALACASCHALADAKALEPDQRRFLGLSQDCVSCHEDPHEGALGTDCAACHGQAQPFDQVAQFDHDPSFPLSGGHAGLACERCHDPGGRFSVAALQRRHPPQPRGCTDCHRSPHRPDFVRGVAAARRIRRDDTCRLCHDAEHGAFVGDAAAMPQELHAATGFALDPPHHEQECVECHAEYGKRGRLPDTEELSGRFAALFPGRSPDDCRACHGDPHEGQFDAGATQGRCLACHEPTHFAPSTFVLARHAETRFALQGAHETVACNDCHVQERGRRRFVPTPTACADCHEDVHEGQFDRGTTKGRCTVCHEPAHFVPSTFDLTHHARTRFPLTGAHQAVGCDRCHPLEGDRRRFVPTPAACADCHADVHDGQFDGWGKPAVVAGQRGCARCHGTSSFTDVGWSSEAHLLWTDYPLNGPHAGVSCIDCHRREPDANRRGWTLGKAPRDCAGCHVDPHAGQFRQGGRTNCLRCHSDNESFAQTHFDHQRDARFKLDEFHATLACSACHKPVRAPTGVAVVRYRPLGMRCEDCHDARRLQRGRRR